jgi:hypothetical protein
MHVNDAIDCGVNRSMQHTELPGRRCRSPRALSLPALHPSDGHSGLLLRSTCVPGNVNCRTVHGRSLFLQISAALIRRSLSGNTKSAGRNVSSELGTWQFIQADSASRRVLRCGSSERESRREFEEHARLRDTKWIVVRDAGAMCSSRRGVTSNPDLLQTNAAGFTGGIGFSQRCDDGGYVQGERRSLRTNVVRFTRR